MPDGADKPATQHGTTSGSSQVIERKLATILSADVAEFSRLMSEDEEQTLRAFRGHKKIFEALVTTHHGRVFNTAGDAILAEFSSAVEAVRCATDVQSALRTRNDKFPPNRQVRFRIGVNLGDVMIQGQDLLGDGVNLAARLQTAAEPGGICISGSVHDQIQNKLSLTFQSLGERSYKNIPQPVRTFSIVEAEGGTVLPSPKPQSAFKKSAAIWIAAGIVAAAGIGFGAFVLYQHGRLQGVPATSEVNQTAPQTLATASAVSPPAANPAPPVQDKVEASATPAKKTNPPSDVKLTAKPETSAVAAVPAKRPHPNARSGRFDGVYSGPVCYGKTPKLQNHCYTAEGTVTGSKLTGNWPVTKEGGLTVVMDGDVSPSGDVSIVMYSNRADGARAGTIKMTGTVHDGSLEASGSFERGRPANLNWRIKP